jgi:hypothetical protein
MSKDDGRQAFVRLAEARTNKILKSIDLLGNLSNKSNYSYSDEDIRKIFKAINERAAHIATKFQSAGGGKKKDEFKL